MDFRLKRSASDKWLEITDNENCYKNVIEIIELFYRSLYSYFHNNTKIAKFCYYIIQYLDIFYSSSKEDYIALQTKKSISEFTDH